MNRDKTIDRQEEILTPIREELMRRAEIGEITFEEAEKELKDIYEKAYQELIRIYGKPEKYKPDFSPETVSKWKF